MRLVMEAAAMVRGVVAVARSEPKEDASCPFAALIN